MPERRVDLGELRRQQATTRIVNDASGPDEVILVANGRSREWLDQRGWLGGELLPDAAELVLCSVQVSVRLEKYRDHQ
ncbi:MAG: hypothetical protein ABW224_25255 [Kibdelosporangium sp.]